MTRPLRSSILIFALASTLAMSPVGRAGMWNNEQHTFNLCSYDSPDFLILPTSFLLFRLPGLRLSDLRSPYLYDRDGDRIESVYRYSNDDGTLANSYGVSPFDVALFSNVPSFVADGGTTSKTFIPRVADATTGDYRSATSGTNFGTASTWETFDGTNWVAASTPPSNASGMIDILNGHTVTLAAAATVDQFMIDAGGQLTNNPSVALTLADGTGFDMTIAGTYLNQGLALVIQSGATWTVVDGGTYIHNTTSGISTPLAAATLTAGSNFIYRGSSTLVPAISVSGRIYGNLSFDSTSGSWTSGNLTGSGAWTMNGNLTIGSGVTLVESTYSGTETVKGDLVVNGAMNFGSGVSTTVYNGNVIVSGTLGLTNGARSFTIGSGKQLLVNSGGTVNMASGQTATIASNGTGLVNGTFTGVITVNNGGTLGGTGTINAASNNITVNSGGTITGGTNGTTGTLTLTANTLVISGTYLVDVNGGAADRITLTGNLDVTGSTLDFNESNAANAASYTLLSYTGSLAGTFSVVDLPQGYTVQYNLNEIDLVAAPEPSTWIGAALALGAIGFTHRRRFAKRRRVAG